ncbi:hypothetical protein STEG23_032064 [Scotinomys teguina]
MFTRWVCWVRGPTVMGDKPPKSIKPEADFIPKNSKGIEISPRGTKAYPLAETTASVQDSKAVAIGGGYEPLFIVKGILMQREDVTLEWIFLPRKPNKKLKTYIEKISDLIHKGGARTAALRTGSQMCQLSWFLDPGGWSKTAAMDCTSSPPVCTLSLGIDNGEDCKPGVLNLPNVVTFHTIPHAVVTPNHTIIFVASS